MTAVHGTCTAFAGDILMPVGGFDNISTEFALYGVLDDFHHTYLLTEGFVMCFLSLGAIHCMLTVSK